MLIAVHGTSLTDFTVCVTVKVAVRVVPPLSDPVKVTVALLEGDMFKFCVVEIRTRCSEPLVSIATLLIHEADEGHDAVIVERFMLLSVSLVEAESADPLRVTLSTDIEPSAVTVTLHVAV